MDLDSLEDSIVVKMAAGIAVIAICLAIGFRCALSRSLGKIDLSLTRGVTVVEHVDDILDDLDRLELSQRAFLHTGEDRFSEGVVESATDLLQHVDLLKQLPGQSAALSQQIAQMSHSVDSAMNLVGESNDLKHYFGTDAALALLDEAGDRSIQDAQWNAAKLKKLATARVLDRVRGERKLRAVLDVLF